MHKIYLRYPGFKTKAVTLSYDDGVEQDRQFMEIIDRYGLKCTFNLNSGQLYDEEQTFAPGKIHRRMTKKATVELYKNSVHEVAAHTLTHPFINEIPPYLLAEQVLEDRKNLENLFEREVVGMAYPYGLCDDSIMEVCKNCGILYSRTCKQSFDFKLPHDWLQLSPTIHHTDKRLTELTEKFVNIKVGYEPPILFYMWGHTYEFERDNNWNVIEDFAKAIGGKDDIWYATNMEVYECVEAFRALRFSADGMRIFNPTCFDVCFFDSSVKKNITIASGETILLEEE